MILLQIVMVSPGTHLVKKHESLSVTNESKFERGPKLSGYIKAQAFSVNLGAEDKTLYYSLLKLKYSPCYLQHKKD